MLNKSFAVVVMAMVLIIIGCGDQSSPVSSGDVSEQGMSLVGNTSAKIGSEKSSQSSCVPDDGLREPILGNGNADVKFVMFGGFDEPFSKMFWPKLSTLYDMYDRGELCFVYVNRPLPFLEYDNYAAMVGEVAAKFGRFWEYADNIYALDDLDTASINQAAYDAGIRPKKLKRWLQRPVIQNEVESDLVFAIDHGVNGVPSFCINGIWLHGNQPLQNFVNAIDAALNGEALSTGGGGGGGGLGIILVEGEPRTVRIDKSKWTLTLMGVENTTTCVIQVMNFKGVPVTREVTEGNTYRVNGLEFTVEDILYFGENATNEVTLSFTL